MRFRRPSASLVISLLALFVALGGTSYAVISIPKNSVGPKQLKSNAVSSPKVKDGSLLSKDFKKGQVFKPAAYEGRSSSGVALATSPAWTTIASVNVPAGTYFAVGRSTLNGASGTPSILCQLVGSHTPDDDSDLLQAYTLKTAAGYVNRLPLSLSRVIRMNAAGTLSVICNQNGPSVQAFNSHISAVSVASAHIVNNP